MSDFFGATTGIIAAEKSMRDDVLGALQAGKILGEIEAQPAELELKKAHARLYGAEAATKENELTRNRRVAARLQALETGPQAVADPVQKMEAIGNIMLDEGDYTKGMQLLNGVSQSRSRAATAATAEVRKGLLEARTKKLEAERVGGLAGSATDQATWDRIRPELEEAGLTEIPQDFAQAAPILRHIQSSSLTAVQQLTQRERDLDRTARSAHWKAQEKEWDSRIARAGATIALQKERLAVLKKNGGGASPEVTELRREKIKTEKVRREAMQGREEAKRNASLAPVDPAAREIGKSYRNHAGRWGQWTKDGWLPIATPASVDDSDDDDEDDE